MARQTCQIWIMLSFPIEKIHHANWVEHWSGFSDFSSLVNLQTNEIWTITVKKAVNFWTISFSSFGLKKIFVNWKLVSDKVFGLRYDLSFEFEKYRKAELIQSPPSPLHRKFIGSLRLPTCTYRSNKTYTIITGNENTSKYS